MTTPAPLRQRNSPRPADRTAWMTLAFIAGAWVALFPLNRSLWDWVVHDFVGLESGSHAGDAVLESILTAIPS